MERGEEQRGAQDAERINCRESSRRLSRFGKQRARPCDVPDPNRRQQQGRGDDSDKGHAPAQLDAPTAQHVYCREFDEALKDLNLWPAGKREVEIKSLLDALGEEYPEFVSKVRETAVKK